MAPAGNKASQPEFTYLCTETIFRSSSFAASQIKLRVMYQLYVTALYIHNRCRSWSQYFDKESGPSKSTGLAHLDDYFKDLLQEAKRSIKIEQIFKKFFYIFKKDVGNWLVVTMKHLKNLEGGSTPHKELSMTTTFW